MRVLILGGRAPVALDYARRFRAHGAKVFVADSVTCRLCAWSNAVDGVFRVPPPRQEPLAFARTLADLAVRQKIDFLLPTCEEIFYVARYRDALPTGCVAFVDDAEKLRSVHSKITFPAQAAGCGVDVPESAVTGDIDAARAWAAGRAVVLKPEFSRFGVHTRIYRTGVPGEAPSLPPLGRWVVQEFRDGMDVSSFSVALRGELVAHSAYRPSHRLRRSSGYYFEPHRAPRIHEFAVNIARKLNFTGQLAFDWILGADGRYSVLECNPRAVSGLHLFDDRDPVAEALLGMRMGVLEPTNPEPRMLSSVMLTAGLASATRNRTLARWWRDFLRARDVLAVRGDRRPGLGALADLAAFARLARHYHCDLRDVSTRDIEWDGAPLPAL